MPESEIHKTTFRDLVKKDTLRSQQEKFARRGVMEREAIGLAGNITGRTAWDRAVTTAWNPKTHYYTMNETCGLPFMKDNGSRSTVNPIPFSSVRRIIL